MPELDILFLNLHRRYLNYEPNHGGFLGIYLLSAFMNREGYSAKGFSGSLEEGLKIIDELCSENKISMLGLYCDYDNVTENIFLGSYVKEKFNLPVIAGGPQATALDENFFVKSKCDAVVRYEGELTVLELANFFLEGTGSLEKISGITYLTPDGLRKNVERPLIQNLDSLPFIDPNCYLEPGHYHRGLSLMTGRGCPFHCAFCHEGSHTRQVRFRSVENVLEEIDLYLQNHGTDREFFIFFTDDTFTLGFERLKKICEGLSERRKKYDFKFFCEGHIHTLYKNPDMIKYLAEAGCIRIQLGIEAGTEKILKAYGKNTNLEEIFEVVRLCRDSGIQQVYGNIILGGAYFSREVFEQDKKFVREIIRESQGVLEIGTVTFWPLSETKMTRCPEEFGIKICDAEFLTSVGDFPQIETEEISRFEIMEMQLELQNEISELMISMLENDEIPTERILNWFPKLNTKCGAIRPSGMWYLELMKNENLYAYYEMLKLGEGFQSKDIKNLSAAHPLRVVVLYKFLRTVGEHAELFGEKFSGKEIEVVLLTTGKLSVAEIAERVGLEISKAVEVLNRLEKRHLIVYTLH